jgi:uncharacterized protein (DUF58 family)
MTHWRGTAALARALAVGAIGLGVALMLGRPVGVVLVAPLVLAGAIALLTKPEHEPVVNIELAHTSLHEGQGTTSYVRLLHAEDVEYVTRVCAQAPYVALKPADGIYGYLVEKNEPLRISPRRWGKRVIGEEKIALYAPWGGYRWGPTAQMGLEMFVLPATIRHQSAAEAPPPIGLIGAHRSRRDGDGTEFSSIRPFHAGDRLRRINWRVSLRTDSLHVVSSRSEEDTAVLLIVDALADYGLSGGIDSTESSLDVAMRSAAAIAEQHIRGGDRVSLRVLSPQGEYVGYGAGTRHLRRILGQLARVRPGPPHDVDVERIDFRTTAGTVVIVLSPMLSEAVATATVRLARRGLPVMVIDTLPPDAAPTVSRDTDAGIAQMAWRMRLVERGHVLDRLAGAGCPIVPWSGPGTLAEVMRRLARGSQVPRVRAR